MNVRRPLVLVVLLYVTLDLSMAAMPGAFVFEAGESVESVQMGRARHVAAIAPAFAPSRDPRSVIPTEGEVRLLPSVLRPVVAPMLPRRGDSSPGSTPEPPPLSEDSH